MGNVYGAAIGYGRVRELAVRLERSMEAVICFDTVVARESLESQVEKLEQLAGPEAAWEVVESVFGVVDPDNRLGYLS